MITILTSTYNKAHFLREAAESVFAQTREDWLWWLVLDGPDNETWDFAEQDEIALHPFVRRFYFSKPKDRFSTYRPAELFNLLVPTLLTDYFIWLSDDDLLDPAALETLAGALDEHPDWDIVHGKCEVQEEQPDGSFLSKGFLGGQHDVGLGTKSWPDCLIDGGQFMQTKRSWDALGDWRIPTEIGPATHADGVYMNKLAEMFTFHYVDKKVLTKRNTRLSFHGRPEWATK